VRNAGTSSSAFRAFFGASAGDSRKNLQQASEVRLGDLEGARVPARGRDDVAVLIHPDDLAGLRLPLRAALARTDDRGARRGRLIQYLTRTPADPTPVEDGAVLPILGGLLVVHTPGHTPGSICLYLERHRLLFTGDVLQVVRGRLTYASALFSHDLVGARASVERLSALDVEVIALSHYPPWREDCNATLDRLASPVAG
jgi:glyoxylase-like metal-dependent hydrolase (beta-lactamase superfamily II)